MDYKYRLEPLGCQRQAFAEAYGKPAFALIMDQGTGKTKATLDEAFNLAMLGTINALLVFAPNDVHRAWVNEELPKHQLDAVPVTAVIWDGKKTKRKLAEIETLFQPDGRFHLLAINTEAVQAGKASTNRAWMLAKRFLVAHTAMMAVDESQDIKTPKTQRTRAVVALGRYAKLRRILTGTVITQTPFDFYSQFRFLDPDILGFQTFASFKAQFGTFERKRSQHKRMNPQTGRLENIEYDALVEYKNLDQLLELVKPHCFRVEKRDALPDLPDKIYAPPRRVELSTAQKRLYQPLLKDGVAELGAEVKQHPVAVAAVSLEDQLWAYCSEPDVPHVVAKLAITLAGKLRQITGGTVRDADGTWQRIEPQPPKLRALLADIEHNPEPALIWCIYQEEIEIVAEALREKYGPAAVVVYSGRYDDDQRDDAKRLFQDPESPAKYFVTSYAAARGHTLIKATASYYYSVHDSVERRIQSEDRNHRAGAVGMAKDGRRCVLYTDYVVAGTVDERRYEQTMRNVAEAREKMRALRR